MRCFHSKDVDSPQPHQDLCHYVQQVRSLVIALSLAARRLWPLHRLEISSSHKTGGLSRANVLAGVLPNAVPHRY